MEQQLAFLKRHGFVIAGVGLPLVVVLAVALARLVPRYFVEDPRYDVVYVVQVGYGDATKDRVHDIAAVDGRVRVRWTVVEEPAYQAPQRIFRLDAASGEVTELAVPEAGDLQALGGSQELFVEGLDDVRLDPSLIAPDGYAFETVWSGGGGLFGDLFFHGPRGPRTTIHKSGRRIEVPQPGQELYGYSSVALLGWCLPAEAGR